MSSSAVSILSGGGGGDAAARLPRPLHVDGAPDVRRGPGGAAGAPPLGPGRAVTAAGLAPGPFTAELPVRGAAGGAASGRWPRGAPRAHARALGGSLPARASPRPASRQPRGTAPWSLLLVRGCCPHPSPTRFCLSFCGFAYCSPGPSASQQNFFVDSETWRKIPARWRSSGASWPHLKTLASACVRKKNLFTKRGRGRSNEVIRRREAPSNSFVWCSLFCV